MRGPPWLINKASPRNSSNAGVGIAQQRQVDPLMSKHNNSDRRCEYVQGDKPAGATRRAHASASRSQDWFRVWLEQCSLIHSRMNAVSDPEKTRLGTVADKLRSQLSPDVCRFEAEQWPPDRWPAFQDFFLATLTACCVFSLWKGVAPLWSVDEVHCVPTYWHTMKSHMQIPAATSVLFSDFSNVVPTTLPLNSELMYQTTLTAVTETPRHTQEAG